MLPKKMAKRIEASSNPQLESREEGDEKKEAEEELVQWRSNLNSIVEGFNSLPKDEGDWLLIKR